jgi:hypothetical protein
VRLAYGDSERLRPPTLAPLPPQVIPQAGVAPRGSSHTSSSPSTSTTCLCIARSALMLTAGSRLGASPLPFTWGLRHNSYGISADLSHRVLLRAKSKYRLRARIVTGPMDHSRSSMRRAGKTLA